MGEVDTSWATSERIKTMLVTVTERETPKTRAGKQFGVNIDAANALNQHLWGADM